MIGKACQFMIDVWGKEVKYDCSSCEKVLGMQFRPFDPMITDMVNSMEALKKE